jgi:hypothetical protein
MTTETLMTTEATNTTDGQSASTDATNASATTTAPAQGASTTQQATEGQTTPAVTADTKPADGEKPADDQAAKPQGAPEKYEFKAPEGAAPFDDQVINQFSEVARELNLPQDAAQKVLDKMGPAIQARQAEQIQTARNSWAESAKQDKEFGGEKLAENLATAKKALDAFGSPELRALLDASGLGNHPEMIRVLYRAGKAISEDRFVGTGRSGTPTPKSQSDYAKALYPSQQTTH